MKAFFSFFLTLMLIGSNAHALGLDAWDSGFTIDFNEQWLREDAYNRAMSQARKDMQPAGKGGSADKPSVATDILFTGTLVEVGGRFVEKDSVARLAKLFPSAQRDEAQTLFVKMIASFNGSVEKLYGVPKENVATGMVALLAGAYAAAYNKPFPDRLVKPAVMQVGDYLRKKPELFKGKTHEKMDSYQTSVGLGMLLMLLQQELQKNPNAAHEAELKKVGASVFRAVLGVEPQQLRFTSAGIRFD